MSRTFIARVLGVLCATVFTICAGVPSIAATNVATLAVNAGVTSNCVVSTQPALLTMSYDTVLNIGTLGASSFTYVCTQGVSVLVLPTSAHHGASVGSSNWEAVNGTNNLAYLLYNDTACSANQLTNGMAETLPSGTGVAQTYNICAVPNTTLQQNLPAGTYTDTVTFTFDLMP